MRVLIGHSYFLRFDPKLWEGMQPYPPLGTMVAAAVLREQGHSVSLFDAMLADSVDEWERALQETDPSLAVIYEDNFNYLSKMCLLNMREAAFQMVALAKERGCTVISAGSDASDHVSDYLAAGADYVIVGEGEHSLCELVGALESDTQKPLEGILGIAYQSNGAATRNPPRPVIRDVDGLPFPAWDLVDVSRYRQIWKERHGYYSMNMVTTRGCPYHCNWCAKPIWGQRYNARSPRAVVEEMRWLQEAYQPDHIWFADDIMGLRPGWWRQFAALAQENGVQIPFKCLSRADLIIRDRDELAAIKEAGCDVVWLGAESGSQRVLDAMEKGITVEQIREATALLHGAGIRVAFFLQFGYPGESRDDIDKTLQMVRECAPDDIGVSVSYPLPGTRFHENVRFQLGAKQNWMDSADLDMMYQGPFTTAFYRQLHHVLHTEFRARGAARSLRSVATSPRAWRRRHLREAAAMVYRCGKLPLARWRLNRLAKIPHEGVAALPHMSLAQASRPSPQTE
jgi:anaerobic magnesium-protoporphyrin IX monomethyl ester cyclase